MCVHSSTFGPTLTNDDPNLILDRIVYHLTLLGMAAKRARVTKCSVPSLFKSRVQKAAASSYRASPHLKWWRLSLKKRLKVHIIVFMSSICSLKLYCYICHSPYHSTLLECLKKNWTISFGTVLNLATLSESSPWRFGKSIKFWPCAMCWVET